MSKNTLFSKNILIILNICTKFHAFLFVINIRIAISLSVFNLYLTIFQIVLILFGKKKCAMLVCQMASYFLEINFYFKITGYFKNPSMFSVWPFNGYLLSLFFSFKSLVIAKRKTKSTCTLHWGRKSSNRKVSDQNRVTYT